MFDNRQTDATNSRTSFSTQDIHDAFDMMEKIKIRQDLSKSATYFAILSMSNCGRCGQKAEYREGPPETVVLCACMVAELKKLSKPDPAGRPKSPFDVPMIGGFVVETKLPTPF